MGFNHYKYKNINSNSKDGKNEKKQLLSGFSLLSTAQIIHAPSNQQKVLGNVVFMLCSFLIKVADISHHSFVYSDNSHRYSEITFVVPTMGQVQRWCLLVRLHKVRPPQNYL